MNYYSQQGEDYVAHKLLGNGPGFFVDIGAMGGIRLSNTYIFEKLGWTGICVEPHPVFFKMCKKNRPNSKCYEAAISNIDGITDFNLNDAGILSTLRMDLDEKLLKEKWKKRFSGYKKIKVVSKTLNTLLKENACPKNFDLLSIDVEWGEKFVLEGLNLFDWRPKLIIIEINNTEDRSWFNNYFSQFKYKLGKRIKWNSFYCNNKKHIKALKNIDHRLANILPKNKQLDLM